jgi:hypothetical protein
MTTTPNMSLAELAEKDADTNLLREMIQFAAQQMMEKSYACRTDPLPRASGIRVSSTCLQLKKRHDALEKLMTDPKC